MRYATVFSLFVLVGCAEGLASVQEDEGAGTAGSGGTSTGNAGASGDAGTAGAAAGGKTSGGSGGSSGGGGNGGSGGGSSSGGGGGGGGANPAGTGGAATAGTGGSGNAGSGNAGSGNAGSGNAGSGNAGSGNAGTGNAGSGNAGAGNAGSGNAGSGNAGSGNAGSGNAGAGSAGAGSGGAGSGGAGSGGAGSGGAGSGGAGSGGAGAGGSPATCPVPPEACQDGNQSRTGGCKNALVIGRIIAASGYSKSSSTCGVSDNEDESDSSCWDAGGDHAYRIFLSAGDSVSIVYDTGFACVDFFDGTLKIYEPSSATCAALTGKCTAAGGALNRKLCERNISASAKNFTATIPGWHYLIVDGSTAFDDEGDYKFTVKLTCATPGCGC